MESKIIHNVKAHNQIAEVYNIKHPEIYNAVEQKRLSEHIRKILKLSPFKGPIKVLDLGAGTGNLSLKFLDEGCYVSAADVSNKSLAILNEYSNNNPRLNTVLLTRKDLPFKDSTFDIVCVYSVLHHIPDYLFTLKEMIRVTKKGGLIYIDHEANEEKWNPSPCLNEYYNITKMSRFEHITKLVKTKEIFTYDFWKSAFITSFINPKYKREGDIHVWKDDHLNWNKIFNIFKHNKCKPILNLDYLIYNPRGGINLYNDVKNKCSDTRCIILIKN